MPLKSLKAPIAKLLQPAAPAADAGPAAALDGATAEQLAAIAFEAGEEALRAAAIRRLPAGVPLQQLAGLGVPAPPCPALAPCARARLAQLIDAGAADPVHLASASGSTPAWLAVAELCSDPLHLQRAVAAIGDRRQLAALVVDGATLRLRQLAAERIEDGDELRMLLKQLRGKDKSVYRILKDKRDALNAEARRLEQLDKDMEALCASLEGLSHHVPDALYAPTFEHFESRWQAIDVQAPVPLRERARAAIARCREVRDAHARQQALRDAESARQAAQEAAQQAVRAAAVAEQQSNARRLAEEAATAAAEAAHQQQLEAQQRRDAQAAEAVALRQIGGLLAKAHSALRAGRSGPAAGLRRAIEGKLARVAALPPALAASLHQLDARLGELREWKDYAVAPKRAQLVSAMEALIGSADPPPALAARIRQLRADWKTVSKGIVIDSEEDWQRFNRAAAAAYEPCREYFEAQARARAENLERRRSLLDRLLAFEASQAGEPVDWRALQQVGHEARREWRRIGPVERAANAPLEQEFEASLARLRERLRAWHAQNVAARRALIERAQALLGMADGHAATLAVKALQREWRDAGAVPRELDGPLWFEFRGHCDAVFQKRQQAHADYAAGLEASRAQALALCEAAEQFPHQAEVAPAAGAAAIEQWRASYAALGELPRADARELHARFERALRRCEQHLARLRAGDEARAFDELLAAAALIRAYGVALAGNAAPAECDALRQAAEAHVAAAQRWPKGAAPALKAAWSEAAAATAAGMADNERALRLLCIRSEIRSGRDTPAEDQGLRREYQLQRLVRSMGRPDDGEPDDWPSLALQWARVGPVPAAAHDALLARFLGGRQPARAAR